MLLLATLLLALPHTCIHDSLSHQSKPSPKTVKKTLSKRAPGKIRIKIDTSFLNAGVDAGNACYQTGQSISVELSSYVCEAADVITQEKYDWLVGTLLPAAEAVLEESLYVEPLDPGVTFSPGQGNECGFGDLEQVIIPDDIMEDGVPDEDLIVFVTGRPIRANNVLAYGGECRHDEETRRAVAGQLNFSPKSITPGEDLWMQVGTTLHEITHVMGFSWTKFSYFRERNPDGSFTGSFASRDDVTSEVSYSKTTDVTTVVTTPLVQEYAREYFNCSTLVGPSLEDGGSAGTALSHWEKRDFFNEYMTGSSSVDPIFSELTLRLLVDAGWYVDYDASHTGVGELVWGRGKGCKFVSEPCNAESGGWPSPDEHPGYFCLENGDRSCSFDLKASAKCGIIEWSPAPPDGNRYFGDSKGGLSSLADFCPYAYTQAEDYCTDGTRRSSGESFGPDSRCFDTKISSVSAFGATTPSEYKCYNTVCISNEHLKVEVGDGKWYDCGLVDTGVVDKNDNRILEQVDDFDPADQTGQVLCPNAAQILAVCAEREKDERWPTIGDIDPAEGPPGTAITIKGRGFAAAENITVDIHGPTEDVTVSEDGTQITCTIPNSDHFRSPTHLFSEDVDVIVTNAPLEEGESPRSSIRTDGFAVKVTANADFIAGSFAWLGDNPIYAVIAGFSLLLGCLCCAYCLCSGNDEKSKRGNYEGDSYYY